MRIKCAYASKFLCKFLEYIPVGLLNINVFTFVIEVDYSWAYEFNIVCTFFLPHIYNAPEEIESSI